jgi:uncharacterized protein (TIGR03435 family)
MHSANHAQATTPYVGAFDDRAVVSLPMRPRPLIAGAVILVLLDIGLVAQAPTRTFEVVSIKKRVERLRRPGIDVIKGGTFKMPEVTVALLVRFAWQLRDVRFQLVGGPDWMRSSWFEVEARAASDTPSLDEVRLMVRSMLEDRFGLTVHWERRDMRVYSLELARNDGRLGPYLQRWDDCSKPAPRPSFPGDGTQAISCGLITDVAMSLSFWLDRPVVDATRLAGTFQYGWHVPPELDAVLVNGVVQLPRSRVSAAIEEQLGLTLKDARRPVEVLVVDSLKQPTEN